jgi:hypothetical protein
MKIKMRIKTLTLCTAMALWVAPALSVRLSAQTITTFDAPGAGTGFFEGTFANSMNPAGVITGFYTDTSSVAHGFLRATDGIITTFDAPGAGTGSFQGTNPNSISWVGAITGYYTDAGFAFHGFVRAKDGTITVFDPPGSTFTNSGAINPLGTIAGYYCDDVGACHGFLRAKDGTITAFDPPGSAWSIFAPFDNNNQLPIAINPLGAIAGYYLDANFAAHGFLRSK